MSVVTMTADNFRAQNKTIELVSTENQLQTNMEILWLNQTPPFINPFIWIPSTLHISSIFYVKHFYKIHLPKGS